MNKPNTSKMIPKLGLLDATMIVTGSMIGTGVYIVASDMFSKLGGSGWFIAIWILASGLTIIAALAYAELGILFPFAGGQYIYLKEAYNEMTGFLYGWCMFLVVQTGTIAAVAYGFAKFFAIINPAFSEAHIILNIGNYHLSSASVVAIASIFLLTWIHTKGVDGGKNIQTVITIAKLGSMVLLIGFGLYFAFDKNIWHQNWINPFRLQHWNFQSLQWQDITAFAGLAFIIPSLVGAFFANDAWYNITFIAAEIKNPKRNIVLSLVLGTVIVAIVYLCINTLYLGIISKNEIANLKTGSLGLLLSEKIFGTFGVAILSVMMMISALGCNNGIILSGARIYYSMAKDKLFFQKFSTLNKHSVPANALWLQGIWASILCLSGTYNTLLNYVISIVLIFFILSVYAVFIFRKKMPNAERVYKTVGYPFLPMLYIFITAIIGIGLFVFVPSNTLFGLLILALGIIVYYFFKKKKIKS